MNSRTADSGSAPTNVSTILPSCTAKTAGIDWTAKAWDTLGFASTSTLTSSTAPLVSPMTFSRMGPSVLHGPHHSAHRSTTTGTLIERSMTAVANVASVTSFTQTSLTALEADGEGHPPLLAFATMESAVPAIDRK